MTYTEEGTCNFHYVFNAVIECLPFLFVFKRPWIQISARPRIGCSVQLYKYGCYGDSEFPQFRLVQSNTTRGAEWALTHNQEVTDICHAERSDRNPKTFNAVMTMLPAAEIEVIFSISKLGFQFHKDVSKGLLIRHSCFQIMSSVTEQNHEYPQT
jgi:hypothetical protein